MYRRPNLYTSYSSETSILPTWTQRVAMTVLAALAVLLPFSLPVINQIPLIRFLGDSDWLRITTQAVIFAVAALGLQLLTGVSGQVSLGHSFFMGVGAYTAVFLGGEASGQAWGHGLPMWIWLPGAGFGAALVGMIVAPAALRVRGLYLAIVTVGLVFIGIHLSRVFPEISGQSEVGRNFPPLEFKWWKEEDPVISFTDDGQWLWFDVTGEQKSYLFALALLGDLHRRRQEPRPHAYRTGPPGDPRPRRRRRDHGCAGVPLQDQSPSPSRRSSPVSLVPCSRPSSVACHRSTGTSRSPSSSSPSSSSAAPGRSPAALLGTFFVVLLPQNLEQFVRWMSEQAAGSGPWAKFWDFFVSTGTGDFGFVSDAQVAPGFPLPSSALDAVLYGSLIIIFLLFEPRGLFGIWVKIRNYWKGWPFTY